MFSIQSYIKKLKSGKYRVYSEKGRNMGTYASLKKAKKRLKDIEFFKHRGGIMEIKSAEEAMQESQIDMGKNVEMEHEKTISDLVKELNPNIKEKELDAIIEKIAEKIAQDHINEISNYYTKLSEMESFAEKGKQSSRIEEPSTHETSGVEDNRLFTQNTVPAAELMTGGKGYEVAAPVDMGIAASLKDSKEWDGDEVIKQETNPWDLKETK